MNKHDILKRMIRHFPGGIEVVALRLGKTVSTLEKELRQAPGYKLCMNDAEEISCMCIDAASEHCHDYVNAVALRGGVAIQLLPQASTLKSLRLCLSDVVKEASDVLTAGVVSLADDDVSDNDEKLISRELAELLAKIQEVQRGVTAAHEACKRRAGGAA